MINLDIICAANKEVTEKKSFKPIKTLYTPNLQVVLLKETHT